MGKKILITGVAWFIGSNLAQALVEKWWSVIWIDNFSTWHKQNIVPLVWNDNFTFIEGDIRNKETIDWIIKKERIEYISHQAARGSVPKSVENPILTNEINIDGTLNILSSAKENNLKKVVVAISSSVYGDTPQLPKVESMEYNPMSPYATTKVTKEIYCKNFWELYDLPTIWLRYFNVYGRRQDPNGDYAAVIPRWIYKAMDNQNLPLNWEWTQTRDFTYIDDVIQANIQALETSNTKAYGRWFNICYHQQISIRQLAKEIIIATKSTSEIIGAPARKWDIQDSYGDYSQAKDAFWYQPQFDMKQGLQHTIEWYQKNTSYFQ